MIRILKTIKRIAAVLIILVLTIYLVRAFDARRMPEPGPEHRIEFAHEFAAGQEASTDWAAYLAIENALAIELAESIGDDDRTASLFDRHSSNSLTSPANYDANWNHSFEISASAPRGVAVLLHGLSDSPYSLLPTAQALVGAGYNIVAPRMPGHGFAAGGLLQARWEDWTAAVRIAIRHAMQLPGADQSLLLVGYSNGGLMAVDYALRCDELPDMPCPDALVLLSPAIAVSSLAVVTNWHSLISWLPYFEKFKWLSILPEVEPFKFTSFPKQAAWEIYKISTRTHKQLSQPVEVARLPPILTFQSVVDNTISASAIVSNLYRRLSDNGSELVLYDVNRSHSAVHLMRNPAANPADYFIAAAPLKYGVTVLGNGDGDSQQIYAVTLRAGQESAETYQTELHWPVGMYSLSHIALPFRPDDQVYGNGLSKNNSKNGVIFGAMAPRGELRVLRLPADYFLRARYNPFFSYQAAYMTDWLNNLRTTQATSH